jgi:hypothetical protein
MPASAPHSTLGFQVAATNAGPRGRGAAATNACPTLLAATGGVEATNACPTVAQHGQDRSDRFWSEGSLSRQQTLSVSLAEGILHSMPCCYKDIEVKSSDYLCFLLEQAHTPADLKG